MSVHGVVRTDPTADVEGEKPTTSVPSVPPTASKVEILRRRTDSLGANTDRAYLKIEVDEFYLKIPLQSSRRLVYTEVAIQILPVLVKVTAEHALDDWIGDVLKGFAHSSLEAETNIEDIKRPSRRRALSAL
jgi:hypothetical protein